MVLFAAMVFLGGCPSVVGPSDGGSTSPPPNGNIDLGDTVDAGAPDAGSDDIVRAAEGVHDMDLANAGLSRTIPLEFEEAGIYAVGVRRLGGTSCLTDAVFLDFTDGGGNFILSLYSGVGECRIEFFSFPAGVGYMTARADGYQPVPLEVWIEQADIEPYGDDPQRTFAAEPGAATVYTFDVVQPELMSVDLDVQGGVCGSNAAASLLVQQPSTPDLWYSYLPIVSSYMCTSGSVLVPASTAAIAVAQFPDFTPVQIDLEVGPRRAVPLPFGDRVTGEHGEGGYFSFSIDEPSWIRAHNFADGSLTCATMALWSKDPVWGWRYWNAGAYGYGLPDDTSCGYLSSFVGPGEYFLIMENYGDLVPEFDLELRLEEPVELVDGEVVMDTLVNWGDADVFTFSKQEEGLHSVQLGDGAGLCDQASFEIRFLRLWKITDNELEIVHYIDTWDEPCPVSQVWLAAGDYAIEIAGEFGEYQLRASPVDTAAIGEACDRAGLENYCEGEARCLMTEEDGVGVCGVLDDGEPLPEVEPNQTLDEALADPIAVPARRRASVTEQGGGDPFDVFVVDLAQETTLQVATWGDTVLCDDEDTMVMRVDEDALASGEADLELATAGVYASNDQHLGSNCAILTETLPAGRHVFVITSFAQAFAFEYEVSFAAREEAGAGERCDPNALEIICADDLSCIDADLNGDGVCGG